MTGGAAAVISMGGSDVLGPIEVPRKEGLDVIGGGFRFTTNEFVL